MFTNPEKALRNNELVSSRKEGGRRPYLVGKGTEQHLEYCDIEEVKGRRVVGMLVVPTLDPDKEIATTKSVSPELKIACEICEDAPEGSGNLGIFRASEIIVYTDESQRYICNFHKPKSEEDSDLWYQQ